MEIDERLSRDGIALGAIPLRTTRSRVWQRLDCPFCGHVRAVISYEANWFECFACKRTLSGSSDDPDELAVNRFAEQIEKAAARVMREFGGWLNGQRDDVIAQARYYAWNYVAGNPGDPFDAGMLPEWAEMCNGAEEPWRLDAMVQKALHEDLMNWAKQLARWKEDNRLTAVPGEDDPVKPEDAGPDRRVMNKRANDAIRQGRRPRYYRSAEPKGTNLNPGRVRYGSLEHCNLQRNGLGPFPGHCRWCDRLMGRPAEVPSEDIDLYREDSSTRERFPVLYAMEVGHRTQAQIADDMGISVSAVKQRAAEEKRRYERLADSAEAA